MLTDQQIETAKRSIPDFPERLHEHPDCIRIAYAWLDAQIKTKQPNKRKQLALKHIIERWAGRYISQSDVTVAAYMHPEISGTYPFFNISSRLTEPSLDRLSDISEAMQQTNYRDGYDDSIYSQQE